MSFLDDALDAPELGGVEKPKFALPGGGLIIGAELHRLTKLHVKYAFGDDAPIKRATLPPKWVDYYSRFDNTEWVTEELYAAMRVWAKVNKKYPGPGTFDMWLEDEYKDWVRKQEAKGNVNANARDEAQTQAQEQAAKEVRDKEELVLLAEFHSITKSEQDQYRIDTEEILRGRFPVLPPSRVVEVNAAKLWKSKT